MKKVLSKIMASLLTLSMLMSYLPTVSIKAETPVTPDSKHTVIFTDKSGTTLVTQSIADGDACVLPDVPDEEGYAFTEWKNVTSGSESTLTSVKDDVTFQATYRKLEARTLIIHYYLKDSTEKLAEDYIGEFYAGEEVNLHIQSPIVMGDTGASFDYEPYFDYVGNIDEIDSYEQVIEYTLQSGSSYIVRFWKQKADTNEYDLDGSVSVAGQTPGLYTEAASYAPADKYAGFTLQPIAEEVISCDNSTVVDVYYDRDSYVLTFDSQGGTYVNSGVLRQGARLGSMIPNASTMVRAGYTFNGWKDSNGTTYTATSTMPTHDLQLIAQWTANRTATYTVMYWQEKAPTVESEWTTDANYLTNPEKYDCVESLTHSARNVGSTPVYDNRTYQGFTFQGAVTPVIQPDGSTVVNVYYKRNVTTITLTRRSTGGVNATIKAKQGTYIADKWLSYQSQYNMYISSSSREGTEYSLQAYMPINGFTVYTAKRNEANQYVVYIVETIENPNQYNVYYELKTKMSAGLTGVDDDVATLKGFGGPNGTSTIHYKDWIGLRTLRTFTGRSIGLVDENATRTYDDSCWISYERLSYPVSFYNGNTKLDEVSVRYEAILNQTYNYASGISTPANVEAYANALGQTLTPPEGVEPDYVFVGWYKDAEGGDPFDWSISMPTSEVKVYAKWAPPTYTLKWHMNENDVADALIEVGGETENVLPKYTLITGSLVPADPTTTKGTYTDPKDGTVYPAADFLGWYLDPECTQPFIDGMQITKDTDVYAKWYDRTHLSYTVYMIDETGETVVVDGEEVEPETYIGQYNGLAEIPEFDNYTLITDADMLLVTDDGQKIIILYRRNSNWHLKREFVDTEGNTIATADDEVLSGEQRIADFETVSGYKLVGVKVNGVAVTGDDAPERVIVTKDKAGNSENTAVVTFVYEPIPPIEYTVEYYLQDETDPSSFVKKADATITGRSAKQGQSVALEEGDEKTFEGYALIPDDARNVRELVLDRNADGDPVLKLYYRNLNVLQPTSVTFSGTKTLTGFPTGSEVEPVFTFTLSEGNEVLDTQTVTKSGTFTFEAIDYEDECEHIYTIAETAGELGGITYDTTVYTVKVTVADDGTGQLVAALTALDSGETVAADQFNFTNTYAAAPTSVTFTGAKTITGRDLAAEEFSFTLTGKEDKVSQTVKNAANGAITFAEITYTAPGTYTYTVSEDDTTAGGVTKDTTVYEITVVVTDPGTGTLSAAISGIAADGSGVDFENTYEAAPTSVTFSGTKTFTGFPDEATVSPVFTFTLKEGNTTIDTASVTKSGSFIFDSIPYTAEGEHIYTIAETDGELNGITYDTTTYYVKVTVTDNGEGQLVAAVTDLITDDAVAVDQFNFTNTYQAEPAVVTFTGVKTMEGRELRPDEFHFNMFERAGAYWECLNKADGTIAFDPITITEPGEYHYTVWEDDTDEGGVTKDSTVYEITVKVTDPGTGKLVAAISGINADGSGLNFTNTYTAEPTSVTLGGVKIFKNYPADITNGPIFGFTVSENDSVIRTATVTKEGTFTFDEITYTTPGDHTYIIAETIPGGPSYITYDTTTYEVHVHVEDNGAGQLVATVKDACDNAYTADYATFQNEYSADPAEVTFSGIKTITGRDLAAEEFSFTLTGKEDKVSETVKNAANGAITFSKITYDKVGTYTYTISEDDTELGGVEKDSTVYEITVVVSDPGNGQLLATITGVNTDGTGADFENTYTAAAAEVTFSGIKTINGRDLAAGEFSFTLTGKEDKVKETVTNAANGAIAFSKITYTKAGTYTYTISEDDTEKGGVEKDSTVYEITVVVSDNGEGQLIAAITGLNKDGSGADFENTYTTEPTSVTLGGVKVLENYPAEIVNGPIFGFTVSENGTVIRTATVTKEGTFTFDEITYTTAGDHTYVIAETTTGGVSYIAYDDTTYVVYVSVEDNGAGQLIATVTDANGDSYTADYATFTNVYSATAAEVSFSGIKTITGRDLAAEEFSFTLTGKEDKVSETVKNAANGAITFSKITYTKVGTYTYTISEDDTELGGVAKDSTVYEITVVVSDNGEGQLVAAITGLNKDGSGADFENTYSTDAAEVTFSGIKTITGRDLAAEEFSFTLTGKEDKVSETVKNAANGAITFSTITYDKVGTYTYTISEDDTNKGGVTKDSTVYEITVVVSDNGEGKLVAAITGVNKDGSGADFENTYTAAPAEVSFSGIKTITGRDLAAEEFSFTLTGKEDKVSETVKNAANGAITFSKITYTKAGTYTYTIAEDDTELGGVEKDSTVYEITVVVTDNGAGKLIAAITGLNKDGSGADFENTYSTDAAEVTFSGIKTITGRDLAAEEFSFTLTGKEDKVSETVKNAANGAITFSKITYTKVGTYTYTIAEDDTNKGGVTKDSTVYEITVVVSDNGEGKLVATITGLNKDGSGADFENTYTTTAAEVSFSGIKTITGRDLAAEEFSFTLTGKEDKVSETVKNAANGAITFSKITYTKVGTYTYTISEDDTNKGGVTKDSTVYEITVVVSDNGEGQLVAAITGLNKDGSGADFENTYTTTAAEVTFSGIKTITGRDLAAEEFSFTLTGKEDKVSETVKNAANGAITFSKITYTKVGTYTYTIAEDDTNKGGVTKDSTVYEITVVVSDNGEGKLVATITGVNKDGSGADFENTYTTTAAEVTFSGIKTITGRDLAAEEFSFTLTGKEDKVSETVKNAANGAITFSKITYTKVGTYTYTIAEDDTNKGGVTKDSTVYEITVVVSDNGEGQLVAAITGLNKDGSGADFENTYTAAPAEVTFSGTKTFTGFPEDSILAPVFTFTVSEAGVVIDTQYVMMNGTFTFDAISYDAEGEHIYTIVEVDDGQGGITFDTTVYTVKVTVSDNGEGQLIALVTDENDSEIAADKFDFTNTYSAAAAEVTFSGIKTLTGRELGAEEFSFTIIGNEDSVNETVKNAADGTIAFSKITYEKVGTYTYTVAEDDTDAVAVSKDTTVYEITVTVTDPGNGKLSAVITGIEEDGSGLNFENVFHKGSLEIKTAVEGDLADPEKEFTYTIIIDAEGEFPYSGSKTGTVKSGDTIQLKDGESVIIEGLPAGTTYTVTESDFDDYIVTYTGDTGSIVADETAVADFLNTKNSLPHTGADYTLSICMSIMGTLSMAGAVLCRKKREDEE